MLSVPFWKYTENLTTCHHHHSHHPGASHLLSHLDDCNTPNWAPHLSLGPLKRLISTLQVMILLRRNPDQLQDEPPGNPPIIHWTKLHSLRNLLSKEAPFTPVPLAFLLDRHTFSSQGLRTYYSAGMLSPWYLTSTLPNFTQVSNWTSFYHRALLLTIRFKSAFPSLSILLPCLTFLYCSHKYLTYYMSHWSVSKFHETRTSVSFTALLSSTRKVPYTW